MKACLDSVQMRAYSGAKLALKKIYLIPFFI